MSLSVEEMQVINLVQAMLCLISPNVRQVHLELVAPWDVRLYFVLERDDPEDREAIEDIVFEFLALQGQMPDVTPEVFVDDTPSGPVALPGRAVYRRREGGAEMPRS